MTIKEKIYNMCLNHDCEPRIYNETTCMHCKYLTKADWNKGCECQLNDFLFLAEQLNLNLNVKVQ